MKATLYLDDRERPVSHLDEVEIVELKQANYRPDSRYRIFYRTKRLNATDVFVELHRDRVMTVKLDDGRSGSVLLAHNSLDMKGQYVGVLRVLGELS